MLAMQYGFTLPADYDMSIIDRRIAEKGHLIDEFPGLTLKAYLYSKKLKREQENIYASFYLWEGSAGFNDFLCGPGFVGLTQSFGWPSVKFWSVWSAVLTTEAKLAKLATRTITPVVHYSDLVELRKCETREANEDVSERKALASVVAFEPKTWSVVKLQLWNAAQNVPQESTLYDVGYVSHTGYNKKS